MRCAPGSPARRWRPSSPRRSSPRWRGRSGSSDSREMATRPVHVVSREVPPEFQLRMAVAIGVVCAAFALVGLRLWYLQVERGAQMRYYSEKNRIRLVRVPAPRGVVYDRNGEILIDNRPSFDVVFVPEDAGERRRQVLRTLAGYLGEEEAGLHQGVRAPGGDREHYQGIVLRRDVDWQGVVALETHQLDLPGVSLRVAPKRYYPFGPLAAHLLGYVGEVSKSELAQDDGDYVGGDLVGKAGLEKTFDKDLRGDPGDQQVEVDALGRRVRVLQEEPDRSGGTLTLTLDRDLQEAADRALGEADGAIVALDPRIAEYAHRLGLGLPTGIALPHEQTGTIPDTEWKRRRFGQPWFEGETLSVAIGQGYVTATPLQMANLAATIANGGTRRRPFYMKRVVSQDGIVLEVEPEVLGQAHLQTTTLGQVREGMREVVMSESGTGKEARVPGIVAAGTPGTSPVVKMSEDRARANRGAQVMRDHA